MINTTKRSLLTATAAAMLIAACGSSPAPTDDALAETPSATSSAEPLDSSDAAFAFQPTADGMPGPVPPGTEPSAEAIAMEGIWSNTVWQTMLIQLGPDGHISIDIEGPIGEGAFVRGTYQVTDGMLTFTTDERSRGCEPGETYTWDLSELTGDSFEKRLVQSTGPVCATDLGTAWHFDRVSPVGSALSAHRPDFADFDDEVTRPSAMNGTWLVVGTGEVWYLRSGRYARTLDGDVIDAPLDRGELEVEDVDGGQSLRFISDGTGTCASEDEVTWTEVAFHEGIRQRRLDGAVRTVVEDDGCGSLAGPVTLVRIA